MESRDKISSKLSTFVNSYLLLKPARETMTCNLIVLTLVMFQRPTNFLHFSQLYSLQVLLGIVESSNLIHITSFSQSVDSCQVHVDHDDGRFLSTMEGQWFLSKNHCVQGFFNGFVTSEPLLSMVFSHLNHWYQWFSNGFSHVNHWYQLFSNGFFYVEPLVLMVFSMVTVYLVFWLWMTEMG